jgi:hypothetical protein
MFGIVFQVDAWVASWVVAPGTTGRLIFIASADVIVAGLIA